MFLIRYIRTHLVIVHFRILFLVLLLVSMVGLLLIYHAQSDDVRYCFMDNEFISSSSSNTAEADLINLYNSDTQRLEDVLLSKAKPTPGHSIFFHETSCHQSPPGDRNFLFNTLRTHSAAINFVQLTARQACAIESAALHNPNYSIFVLFASPSYYDNSTSQPLLEAILSYPNVHFRNLNLWTYAAATPIYEWLKDGKLFKSRFVLSHISDFLRYVTLWRWGGIYLDMDTIMLRSMEDVPPNYTGAESNTHLAAGIMNFAPDGFGHEIAQQCLNDFQRNFDGDDWGNNGPGVITRVMQKVCKTKNIELMMDRKRCIGFNVFDRNAFYAIPWREWEHFFEAQYLEQTLQRTKDSYVVHVWNKHSRQRRVKVGSNVAYGKLAETHCPKVYSSAGEFF